MKQNQLSLTCTDPGRQTLAKDLAARLSLDFIEQPESGTARQYAFTLTLTPDYLGLTRSGDKKFTPFYIDFLSAKLQYRAKQTRHSKELLARAIGIKPRECPKIIDATAGLGHDSFILATLGYHVTLIEQSPILHALLADALARARATGEQTFNNMQLICANSLEWLPTIPDSEKPPVIYLDPMFPARKKSASVKKEMVILQNLLTSCKENKLLLDVALACATRRVVVKRPRLADNLAAKAPNFSITGTSSRFDVYLV